MQQLFQSDSSLSLDISSSPPRSPPRSGLPLLPATSPMRLAAAGSGGSPGRRRFSLASVDETSPVVPHAPSAARPTHSPRRPLRFASGRALSHRSRHVAPISRPVCHVLCSYGQDCLHRGDGVVTGSSVQTWQPRRATYRAHGVYKKELRKVERRTYCLTDLLSVWLAHCLANTPLVRHRCCGTTRAGIVAVVIRSELKPGPGLSPSSRGSIETPADDGEGNSRGLWLESELAATSSTGGGGAVDRAVRWRRARQRRRRKFGLQAQRVQAHETTNAAAATLLHSPQACAASAASPPCQVPGGA